MLGRREKMHVLGWPEPGTEDSAPSGSLTATYKAILWAGEWPAAHGSEGPGAPALSLLDSVRHCVRRGGRGPGGVPDSRGGGGTVGSGPHPGGEQPMRLEAATHLVRHTSPTWGPRPAGPLPCSCSTFCPSQLPAAPVSVHGNHRTQGTSFGGSIGLPSFCVISGADDTVGGGGHRKWISCFL